MGIIVYLFLGALIGWLASLIMNRDAEQGWIANTIVGVVGAFIGSFVSNMLSGKDRSALVLNIGSLFWALVGAVVLCAILNYLTRDKVR